mgnify:CR=1 FL=1
MGEKSIRLLEISVLGVAIVESVLHSRLQVADLLIDLGFLFVNQSY